MVAVDTECILCPLRPTTNLRVVYRIYIIRHKTFRYHRYLQALSENAPTDCRLLWFSYDFVDCTCEDGKWGTKTAWYCRKCRTDLAFTWNVARVY